MGHQPKNGETARLFKVSLSGPLTRRSVSASGLIFAVIVPSVCVYAPGTGILASGPIDCGAGSPEPGYGIC